MKFSTYLPIYRLEYKTYNNEFGGNCAQANTSLRWGIILVASASNTFIYGSGNIFVLKPIVLNMYDKALYQI